MREKRPRWRLRRSARRMPTVSHETSRAHIARARMNEFGVTRLRYLWAVPVLVAAILLIAWLEMPTLHSAQYRPIEDLFANTMIGWAVQATDLSGLYDTSLIYAEATWRELEPEPGKYAFEQFEADNHLQKWWESGKRLILRVVADRPGEPKHMDIPDWLYEMIDGDGDFYEIEAGGGFAPNYANIVMRNRHGELIAALGARYGSHPGLAYIEIGSLGHDGEWSVAREAGVSPLPPPNVARSYTWHYHNALNNTLMLMMRPYREVRTLALGVLNTQLGDDDASWAALNTIERGGYDEQIAADLYVVGEFWRQAPSGAHIAASVQAEALLTEEIGALERQLREGHTSYAVLDSPLTELSDQAIARLRRSSGAMGYRFWIRTAQWDAVIRQGYRAVVTLEIRNDGVAPLYGDWDAVLALRRDGESALLQPLFMNVNEIQPGRNQFQLWMDIPPDLQLGQYELAFAIFDPATGQPAVRLAMEECGEDLWTVLGGIEVVKG